jgi:hypothetical protein
MLYEPQLGEQRPTTTGLDLTKLDVNRLSPPTSGPTPAEAANLEAKPYDPSLDRETTRGTIARTLVWTLVVVIGVVLLAGLGTIWTCHAKDACAADVVDLKPIRAMVELVMTPPIGLVGAVTGFYFGEKSAAGKSGS